MNPNTHPLSDLDKVSEVLALCFKAQNEKECTVFFDLHVASQQFKVQIYINGWIDSNAPNFECRAYIDATEPGNTEFVNQKIEQLTNYIETLPAKP